MEGVICRVCGRRGRRTLDFFMSGSGVVHPFTVVAMSTTPAIVGVDGTRGLAYDTAVPEPLS